MAITEAVTEQRTSTGGSAAAPFPVPAGAPEKTVYRPIPVWFFTFEGVIGASYDIVKTTSYGWVVLAVAIVTNLVFARTVMRGRLKMFKAMIKGRRTRRLAFGLIALRIGTHFVLGLIGVEATTEVAHFAFAGLMCVTTVSVLTFNQRVMLRALNAAA